MLQYATSSALRDRLADDLWNAARRRSPVSPISARHPELTLDDAYAIQGRLRALTVADGARVVGHKIGATSEPIQRMFNIDHPDFGFLTDRMMLRDGATIDVRALIAPKVEAEIAFRMSEDLSGEDVTADDVLAAASAALPVLEILDSRIADWAIRLVDTVADNASSAAVVLGEPASLTGVDLPVTPMEFDVDGLVYRAQGSAVFGHPAESVAWLIRKLATYGAGVSAGDIVLAGAWAAAVDLVPGCDVRATFGSLGSVSLRAR